MLQCRQRRFHQQLAKITSVGTLIGVASMLLDKLHLAVFFYVIPFVAFGFDLFLIGESFTMRRLAAFVREAKTRNLDLEFCWEEFVRLNPNKYSTVGNLGFTLIAAIGSILIVVLTNAARSPWFNNLFNICWLLVIVIFFVSLVCIEQRLAHRTWSVPEMLKVYPKDEGKGHITR